jgi:hypothetical protein
MNPGHTRSSGQRAQQQIVAQLFKDGSANGEQLLHCLKVFEEKKNEKVGGGPPSTGLQPSVPASNAKRRPSTASLKDVDKTRKGLEMDGLDVLSLTEGAKERKKVRYLCLTGTSVDVKIEDKWLQ